MCLPACRIIQTGTRPPEDSPRATRNSRGSEEIDGVVVANDNDDDADKTNNGNFSSEYISLYLYRSPFLTFESNRFGR